MDPSVGEILATCSDDRTIRIYAPAEDFKLLYTISTYFINEWHTITYMALEKVETVLRECARSPFSAQRLPLCRWRAVPGRAQAFCPLAASRILDPAIRQVGVCAALLY